MKGMERRKEGRERLLLAAQDPGPEQGPRISGRDRDPHPSVRSGRERSFPPVGNRIPGFPLPVSLRPFFFRGEHASLRPSFGGSASLHPSFLRGWGEPSFSFSRVTCVPPPFFPLGWNLHPPTVPPLQGSPHPSILQGRNPHPSPSPWPASFRPASTRVPPLAE